MTALPTWYILPSTSMLTALVHSSSSAHWWGHLLRLYMVLLVFFIACHRKLTIGLKVSVLMVKQWKWWLSRVGPWVCGRRAWPAPSSASPHQRGCPGKWNLKKIKHFFMSFHCFWYLPKSVDHKRYTWLVSFWSENSHGRKLWKKLVTICLT